MTHRIVLAHSGGFETAVAIPWLAERYQAEVVAVTLDFGQERELTDVREAALAAGAVRAHVIDAREEFLRDYVLPALAAGAGFDDRLPIARALARALVARRLVDVARMEGASAVAYGSGLEPPVRALDPAIEIIEPARLWSMSREDQIAYARARNISISDATGTERDAHASLWGRSVEGSVPDQPPATAPENVYALTRAPQDCPDEPAYLEVDFVDGVPVRANGIEMPLIELVESLEIIAGAHGVGRLGRTDPGAAGPPVAQEAPAAVLLHAAHKGLEELVAPPQLRTLKPVLSRAYADLVIGGQWFSPAREAIDAFARVVQRRVTGCVRLKLLKGDCTVVALRSTFASEPSQAPVSREAPLQPAVEGLIS